MKESAFLRPVPRLLPALLFGLVLGLILALGWTGTVSAQEGTIAVDCEGNTLKIDEECQFGEQQEFTIAIHTAQAPPQEYGGIQLNLRWNSDIIDYRPEPDPNQEVVWPECGAPARAERRMDEPPITSNLFACVRFPLEPSTYAGPVWLFTFVCVGQGTTSLTPISWEEGERTGSYFVDFRGTELVPSLTEAIVTCGGPAVERPPSEVTPRSAGVATITLPTATPVGQAATPGGPSTTPNGSTAVSPASPTLERAVAEEADTGNDDDGGLGPALWALIGVAGAAVAAGSGFLAWRKLRPRRARS